MEKQYYWSRILILLMVIFLPFSATFGQSEIEITGNVSSANESEPLPGVNILVKGTSTGTITDFDGNFKINAAADAVLIFSYIGFVPQEVPVDGKTNISVQLEQDAENIDEVVVIGYGSEKKSHLTGAISKVTNEGLDEIPVARMDEALVGKVSGVNISMTDASVGGDPTIHVRGVGSITASASPLIVLDGVPVGNDFLGSIDMNTVESIEVLKDAASAAIYGSRGANGVIMITSKAGKKGKTTFSFNSYWGYKFTPNFNRLTSVSEWAQYVDENAAVDNNEARDKVAFAQLIGTETDWEDLMFDGGMIQSYSLAARGGNEKTTFSISGSYLDDDGVLLTDHYKKINLNLNVRTKVNDVIEFGLSANPSYTKKRDFPIGVHDAIRQQPWLPLYHDANTIQYSDKEIGDYAWENDFNGYLLDVDGDGVGDRTVSLGATSNTNAYAKVVERDFVRDTYKLFSNAYLKLNLMDGLSFRTSVSANVSYYYDEDWTGELAHRNGSAETNNDISTQMRLNLVNENIFTYNKSFGKHDLNAVAGVSFETGSWLETQQTGSVYKFDYIRTLNASTPEESTTNKYNDALLSVLGRVNYAYNSKYLLSISLRTDGSSKFGRDTRYGLFPAASVGWRITEEGFMQNVPVISNLKARFSYGVTGNNDIENYLNMSLLSPVTVIFNGAPATGFNPINIANPNLGWEQSVEINPGIDIGLFDNRLNITADYYERTSKDLLLNQPMLSITGFNEATINIGEVKNSGFELEVSANILNNSDLTWNATANYSHNKNELIDYAGADGTISYVDDKRPALYIAKEGYPISSYYGYVYEKDIPLQYLNNPYKLAGQTAQDVYVKDLNGDGIIDEDDQAILGSPYPKHIWSLTNTLTFKGFDLSFMFQGSHGAKIRNMDDEYIENQFNSGSDYITAAADPNFFPDADRVVLKTFTDLRTQDASYIALRNINLGYTLPKTLLSRVGFTKARVYAAASNLLFIMADDYTSFNPEGIRGDDGNPLRAGYQVGAAPIAKTITFGVNLEF